MSSEKQANNNHTEKILSNYEFIPIDKESIIFSKYSHNIHFLNELSTQIWQQYVKAKLSVAEISKEVTQKFEIPYDVARQDIESIIRYWVSSFTDNPFDKNKVLLQKTKKEISFTENPDTYKYQLIIQLPTICIRINCNEPISTKAIKVIFNYLLITPPDYNKHTVDYDLFIVESKNSFLICLTDQLLETANTIDEIAVMVHRAVTELACNHHEWIATLHASAVAYNNYALVFPAVGGSGKSTLAASLIQSGFKLINDDVVPLLENKILSPIPVSLCIKSGSWEVLKKWYPHNETLTVYGRNNLHVKYFQPTLGSIQEQAIKSKFIIVPQYCTQPKKATIHAISHFEALQEIIKAESLLKKPFEKENITKLVDWVKSNQCYKLEYQELDDALQIIRNLTL